MSDFGFLNKNTPNYEKFCIILEDGTKVYRFVAEECPGCNDDYESEFYTDELGNQIDAPNLENSKSCQDYAPKETCWKVEAETLTGDQTAPFEIAPDLIIVSQGGQGDGQGPFSNTAGPLEFSDDGVNFGDWQSTIGGGGNQNVVNTDPIWFRNPTTGTAVIVDITSLSGGGSPQYTAVVELSEQNFNCKLYPDGTQICCDELGNEVELPVNAVQVECPKVFEKLAEIADLLKKQEFKRRCFERPSQFFDTLIVIDSGNRPLTDEICIFPLESGKLVEIRLRVDNLHPGVGAASIHDTISFQFNGQPLIPTQNLNFNPQSPFGQQFDDAWPGINEFRFENLDIDVIADEKYTITASLANGPDPLITWQQQQNAGSADNQVEYSGNQDGNFPAIHWISEGIDCATERTYCDGTVRLFDQLENEIESLSGFEQVPCDKDGIAEQSTVCGTPMGDCRCYGVDSGPNDYVYINSDNETEGSFSNNVTTIKWEVGGGDGSLDGSIPYIDDCINGGGEATMKITDSAGNVVVFVADTIISSNTPTAAYGGTGPGSFSGKVTKVTISCSTNPPSEGKACAFKQDDGSIKWFDSKTGDELTEELCETLTECATDVEVQPACGTDLIEFISCSLEDTDEVDLDDQILTVSVQDCEGVILSSKQYNVTQGNTELTDPVNTTDCDPDPDVTETEECILDTAGQKWTEITIVQDAAIEVIYVNQDTLELGTPAGDPKEWKSCADTVKYLKEVCYIDPETPNGIIGKRWDAEGNAAPFDTNTNIFPTWNTHVNGAADEEVLITNNWALNDVDFPATTGGRDVSSQELYYAWLNITETMKLRDVNGNTGEYISIFLEDCNKDMVQVVKDKYTPNRNTRNAGEFLEICPGIRKIAIQISDFSVFGGFQLQYSTDDGVTWINFPITNTYSQPPKVEKKCILLHDDGNTTNIDGTLFDEELIECDPPCYPMTREALPDTEVSIVDGCDDIDGDPANYVNVTREVIFENGQSTATYYTNYGDEALQTEYTIQGGFVDCATGEPIEEPVVPPPCENWAVIDVYKPVGEAGVNVERWVTNAITGLPTNSTVPSDVFTEDVDYSGMPGHDNGAPDGPIVVQSNLRILDQNNGQDQFRYWTYLYITEPMRVRERFGRAEAVDYYVGECCEAPTLAATGVYPNTGTGLDITLQPGIHYIGGEVFDATAYSGVDYQYSTNNGVTWTRVPAAWLYSTKPTIEQCPAKVCIETGVCADLKTGLELGSEVTLCKPSLCSGSADPVVIQCAPQTFYKVDLPAQGTVEQKWEASATPRITTGDSYKTLAFTGTDSYGMPQHANPADSTVSNNLSQTTNVLNPGVPDQAQSDFWIYLPEEMELGTAAGQAEASGVWLGCDISQMSEVQDALWPNTGASIFGNYPAGIYRVRLYHDDEGTSGTTRLTGDGSLLPAYADKPTVQVVKGWYCSDGKNYNQDRSEELDDTWLCEDPRCTSSGSNGGDSSTISALGIGRTV